MFGMFPKPTKSLDSIMSTFTTTIRDLRDLAAENKERVRVVDESIESLAAEREELLGETSRADSVRTRLESLISA